MIWIFQRVQREDGEGGSLKREHFVNDHTKFIIFLYFKGLSKKVYGARSFATLWLPNQGALMDTLFRTQRHKGLFLQLEISLTKILK